MTKFTRIVRIGNSRGIIVPSEVIKALAIEEGDEVELNYDQGTQVLRATFPKTKQLKFA